MTEWWRSGVIYQVYPRSYMDNNADGIGDLSGIISKLDYIASLGVDAIWMSPFFKSPMKDFGYDVSDYRSVDPMFGTIEDFRRLLDEAHKRNIKIIIDQVWAHTSDQHRWFSESRQTKDNSKADWYIWKEAKPDGTPPNNWLAVFGGPAWTWDSRRQQYYLHHYLPSQPALNWHNAEVRKEIFDIAKFWLEMGVDGFRLDTMHHFLCDSDFKDNPARQPNQPMPNDIPAANPKSRQYRSYCCADPSTIQLIEDIRALTDSYEGDRMLLAEVGGEDNEALACSYVQTGKRMHLAYTFGLLQQKFDKKLVIDTIGHVENLLKDGWLCWATGNHDNSRVVSRWPHENVTPENFARFSMALGLSLRGTYCMYQGEELGLPEAEVPYEMMQDPYGIAFYPEYRGRDGCRTPMPWMKNSKHAGFSDSEKTWLPVTQPHHERAVDAQDKNPASVLNFARTLLAWRKKNPAVQLGSLTFLDTPDNIIGYVREYEGKKIACYFNAHGRDATFPVSGTLDAMHNLAQFEKDALTLNPYGFAFVEVN